ncbi:carbon-nitrogen hydrolase family protein [Paenibacillus eucommiae]|uniref:CN hydrolase domain-containing protein n=1 Tax=Paenibacillus eucommiae TaxID=1355755 RepID=A0ABS4J859_9BACL|nr:carbon-nitrogen hydrolase family protein [Paenibacillus eucommiae]MBP1996036.1 hypothetical protein [Paenibacillus eucommiae]
MAKWVKISTIGMEQYSTKETLTTRQSLEKVKEYIRSQIRQVLPDQPDLIVLPEWCDIPQSHTGSQELRSEFVKERGSEVRELLAAIARENNCYITYPTLIEAEDGTYRNTMQLIDRSGEIAGFYNKNHAVIIEVEENILCGKDANVIECDFGRVACAICFDLNFDPIRLKYVEAKPDIILFPSMYHGGIMQSYWAYSCRSYFVGAVPRHPSAILNPLGDIVATSTNYFNFVTAKVNLDYVTAHLGYNFEKIAAMREKYGPKVNVYDPGNLGPVLITSESDEITALEMTQAFEIELLDDYFARSLACQADPANIEK